MSVVITLDGLDHWVTHVRYDGSSDGCDYDLVHIVCRAPMRFARPVLVCDGELYAPLHERTPTCLTCVAWHIHADSDQTVWEMGRMALAIFCNIYGP